MAILEKHTGRQYKKDAIIKSKYKNVFILCTGRCGSSTFIRACKHITNYTASHESRISKGGYNRLQYPAHHIEADNRLSWFLGRLENKYGDDAFYVHLKRNIKDTAASLLRRYDRGYYESLPQRDL